MKPALNGLRQVLFSSVKKYSSFHCGGACIPSAKYSVAEAAVTATPQLEKGKECQKGKECLALRVEFSKHHY